MPPTKYLRPATPKMVEALRLMAAHPRANAMRSAMVWNLLDTIGAKVAHLEGLRLRGYVERSHFENWVIYDVTDAGRAFLATTQSAS